MRAATTGDISVHVMLDCCYHHCTAVVVRRENLYAVAFRSAVCLLSVWHSEAVSLMAVPSAKRKLPRWLSDSVQRAKFPEFHSFQFYFEFCKFLKNFMVKKTFTTI